MATTGRNRSADVSYDSSKNYNESYIDYGSPDIEQIQQPAEQAQQAPQQQPQQQFEQDTWQIPNASDVVDNVISSSNIARERNYNQPVMQKTEAQDTRQRESESQAPQSTSAQRGQREEQPSSVQASAASLSPTRMGNVPIIPEDTNLAPRISSGRVVSVQSDAASQAVDSAISGNGNVLQPQSPPTTQVRQSVADDVARERVEADEKVVEETAEVKASKQRYVEDQGREAIREAGSFETPAPMNMLSRANRRFKETKKFIQEKISTQMKAKGRVGRSAFQDTIFSLRTIMPDAVSIGSDNLVESLRDPNSSILALVNHANPELQLSREACLANIELLVNAINTSDIEVVFSKQPVNTKGSVQVRTLRAHYGRGIGLHPTQTKAYNADFDGDTGNLNTDQSNLANHSRAMTLLIDAEGKPTIDPDFFPLDYMAMPTSRERDDLIESMGERNFSWDPSVAARVADAYIDACNNGNWVGLLRTIDKIAGDRELQGKHGLRRGQLASRILKNIYDYAIDRRGLNLSAEWVNVIDSYEYTELDENSDPMVVTLVEMVDEIARGRTAPNFQDFTVFFNKQYGDLGGKSVGGKNVPFRLLADFAKAIHRNDLITIGDPIWGIDKKGNKGDATVTMYDLWQFTCSAGVTKLISGRMHMGSHELASKTQVKTIVLETLSRQFGGNPVPQWLPQDDSGSSVKANQEMFRQWMLAFKKAYNSQMRLWNVAQVRFRGGMGIERGNTGKYDGFDSFKDPAFAKAFVEVFGDYAMSRVFPDSILPYGRKGAGDRENTNSGIIWRYGSMSVSDFAIHNRLDWYSEGVIVDPETHERFTLKKIPEMNKRFDAGTFTPLDVIMAVSDRRSKQFGDYEKSWTEATRQHVGIMKKIRDDISRGDFNEYAYDMLEFIHLMSPRMFDHFGMDSPITFAKSKWGKKLMEADTESQFQSTLVSMMVEYRMSRASNLQKSMDELSSEPIRDDRFERRMADLDAHYVNELKQLASSSLAWESIVSETVGQTNAFTTLLRDKKIERRGGEFHLNASDFWNSTNPDDQYSLINFLKSNAAYETKMAVLSDVIKYNTGIDNGIDVKHVIGMLAHNPDPLFAGSRFEMNNGIKSAVDAVKDSINKISSYKSQSPSKVKGIADRIIKRAYEDKQAFEDELFRFANDPGYYIHVNSVLAADAISSIYEKDYSDSEKIKQQTLVNGYFEAVSLQRSGGFFTHLQQTDNAVLNVVGFDQLSSLDIVRILGDPSIELHGYDEFGVPCVYSRSALCGGDSIDDVLRYLEDHPRIALACRRHIAGVSYNSKKPSDASVRLNVLDTRKKSGIDYFDGVFSLLNDRPRFLAIAALITPTQGNVGRNLAELVNDNIKNLTYFIMDEAASGRTGQQVLLDIEDFFGIADNDSFESLIVRLRNEGAFDELEFGIDDYTAARNMFSDVTGELLDCIDVVRESGIELTSVSKSRFRQTIKIDKSSMVAYYDARQQLNGARTAKMIGIEGSETKKNLALREFVRNRPDRFMTVTIDMGRDAILRLSDLTGSNIKAELDASEDGMLVIEVPDGWVAEDWSLEHDPRKQVGSIAKGLEIKREKGAETFNAKSKKFGDDGSNSIIKFFKYGTQSMLRRYGKKNAWTVEDGSDLRKRIAEAGSKEVAIPILAEALMKADARLGYIDMDDVFQKSDYWNKADLMLTEYQNDDGTVSVYIRTLEQLAVAFRNRISDEAIVSENADVVLAELEQLNQVIGTPADPMFNDGVNVMTLDEVRVSSGVGYVSRIERAIRPYSSSIERNYTLMYNIFGRLGKDEFGNMVYEMPTRKEIESRSNDMFLKLMRSSSSFACDLLKGVAYPHDKWEDGDLVIDPDGSRDHIYDYLGRPQDDGFKLIPGPQSLVYFDSESDVSVLEQCRKYGITAAFTNLADIPEKYVNDSILLNGVAILPFFDMELNGSVADAVSPAPGQFFFNRNNVIVSDEDTTFEIAPGDASAVTTQEGANKMRFNLDGDEVFDAFDLFPNLLRTDNAEFVDETFKIEIPRKEEIRRWVMTNEGTIDYGVREGNPNFERERRRFEIRMREYADKFESGMVDENGFVVGDCHYDSIVGFAKIRIGVNTYAFAPIVPFHLEQSSKSFKRMKTTSKKPSKFRIDGKIYADNEGPQYHMRWRFTDDVRGQYIKFFEGIGASNKLMIHGGDFAKSRTLSNGLPIDMIYSTKSVASRLFPTNKRIHTMITMMMIPRIDVNYAYNFAELSDSFPPITDENGEQRILMVEKNGEMVSVKDALLAGTLTRDDWTRIVRDNPNIVYHRDSEINSVVKWFVEKCVKPGTGFQTVNPSIFLATRTSAGILQPTGTEFEAFMDSGYNFQNALMKFMHAMNPTLVPANIEDESETTLFKPVRKDRTSDDYGVLQMMAPHYDADGKYYEVAENIYISFGFFGDEFSGFKKVNFDAANRGVDDLNVSANLDGFDLSQMMSFARASMSNVPSMNVMEPAQDNVMVDVVDQDEDE